jgi:hypothetical protein
LIEERGGAEVDVRATPLSDGEAMNLGMNHSSAPLDDVFP